MQIKNSKFFEVYESEGRNRKILTKNLVPGRSVYCENLIFSGNSEYREWDPSRSKLGAFIMKGADQIAVRPRDIVLYLGAASGTTVSHVSDIVGADGFVFAVDFAPRVVRDLTFLSEVRPNIAPILADANHPERYAHLVTQVDFVYQDIAQPNQVEIFLKNCDMFLKSGGFAMIALKSRSVDVTKKPKEIFEIVRRQLVERIAVTDARLLDPFERDHCMFLCKKK
jgi:fibrillarin-like pre-rRNA processing protein